MLKPFYFKQFILAKVQFSSICPIDRTLLGATTPGQSRLGNADNEGVLCISKSSSITGTSLSDCLVSYPGHSLEESYPSIDKQSVYSTAPADWTMNNDGCFIKITGEKAKYIDKERSDNHSFWKNYHVTGTGNNV